MPTAIPINAPVVLTIGGQGGGWGALVSSMGLSSGIAEVKSAITLSLRNYGFAVVDIDINPDNMIPQLSWPFSGTVTLRSSYDTDSEQLMQQAGLAIQDATGAGAQVGVVSIGKPDELDTPATHDAPDWVKRFLATLQSDAKWIAIGGVGLVALIVVVVGYGPNIKKLASVNL